MNDWHLNIMATHEGPQGLVKDRAWPGSFFPGVALPTPKVDGRWVIVRYGGNYTCAIVWDLGPWAHDDDAYVLGIARPRAEQFKDKHCPLTLSDSVTMATVEDGHGGTRPVANSNGAGIDLFPFTAKLLGISIGDNVLVDWKFVEL